MSIKTLGIGFSVGAQVLLQPLSTELAHGQVTAILGPNGAGKSTLLNLLSGQCRPNTGQIWFNGQRMSLMSAPSLARVRAVMPQQTEVAFDYTVRDVVALGRFPHRHAPSTRETHIVDEALATTDVAHLTGRVLNSLSGGERARAHLARALAQIWEPPADNSARWLLLDEPTAALDLAHQHRSLALARKWAKQHGVGVVAVLHDLNLALRYCDSCLVLQRGRQVACGITQKVVTADCVQQVWGVRATAVQADGLLQYVFA